MKVLYKKILSNEYEIIGIGIALQKDNGKNIMRHLVLIKNGEDIENIKKRLYEHVIKYVNQKKERPNARFWKRYYLYKLQYALKTIIRKP